jgi:hypothetical protein
MFLYKDYMSISKGIDIKTDSLFSIFNINVFKDFRLHLLREDRKRN